MGCVILCAQNIQNL